MVMSGKVTQEITVRSRRFDYVIVTETVIVDRNKLVQWPGGLGKWEVCSSCSGKTKQNKTVHPLYKMVYSEEI